MIAKGPSDIRGIHSINTRPGPITVSRGFLKLYQLAAEKDNLMKKLEWVKRQNDQTKRRLSEILHSMHFMRKVVEERTKNQPAANPNSKFRSLPIKY